MLITISVNKIINIILFNSDYIYYVHLQNWSLLCHTWQGSGLIIGAALMDHSWWVWEPQVLRIKLRTAACKTHSYLLHHLAGLTELTP